MILTLNNICDIYFDRNFPRLYEKIEHGVTEDYQFRCKYGAICYNFIKRPIQQLIDGILYYDLITPYGYGGPVIIEVECEESKQQLVNAFGDAFREYCRENRIVTEFVRFHPFLCNAYDFYSIYDIEHVRNTVGTDLEHYPDFLNYEFSYSCRNNIKQAMHMGVSVEVVEKPKSLEEFKAVYYSTMDRNNAAEFYYFKDDYFDKCLEYYKSHILLVKAIFQEQVIAAGFYFTWNKTVHIHLSGTLSEFLSLSPAYMLRFGVTQWALEKGYKLIHHGGGRSNASNDSLYLFKKQFGVNTEFPFYIGKKIWDEKVYASLCRKIDGTQVGDFFPIYRSTRG